MHWSGRTRRPEPGAFIVTDPPNSENLFTLLSNQPSSRAVPSQPDYAQDQREQPEVQFVSFVLDDVQHTWDRMLPEVRNIPYQHSRLVLFRDATYSGCGTAQEAVGPFYCPKTKRSIWILASSRRIRASLCDRTRNRSPGRGPAWHSSYKCIDWSRPTLTKQTHYPCASNCRPTAMPESGDTPLLNAKSWIKAT